MGERGSYRPLDADSVVEFVEPFVPGPRESEEVGDGNLNLVFKVYGDGGSSVVVKQALPYLRLAGENWPLTLDRARIEAAALEVQNRFAPGTVPRLIHYDSALAAIVMEHLERHEVWRVGLNTQRHYPQAPAVVGRFCGQMFICTSDLGMHPEERKKLTGRFINPELCAITEDLVFTAPFIEAESNDIEEHLTDEAARLRSDKVLAENVAILRFMFRTRAEALIHGDLHTGSVMVAPDDTRVIDPEFAFMGPMGFDVGAVFANLALAHIAHRAQGHKEFAETLPEAADEFWAAFTESVLSRWPASETWRERFIVDLVNDAARYAGAKMIRRIVGLAHVTDITDIEDDQQRYRAQVDAIAGGRALLLSRRVVSVEHLWTLATEGEA